MTYSADHETLFPATPTSGLLVNLMSVSARPVWHMAHNSTPCSHTVCPFSAPPFRRVLKLLKSFLTLLICIALGKAFHASRQFSHTLSLVERQDSWRFGELMAEGHFLFDSVKFTLYSSCDLQCLFPLDCRVIIYHGSKCESKKYYEASRFRKT